MGGKRDNFREREHTAPRKRARPMRTYTLRAADFSTLCSAAGTVTCDLPGSIVPDYASEETSLAFAKDSTPGSVVVRVQNVGGGRLTFTLTDEMEEPPAGSARAPARPPVLVVAPLEAANVRDTWRALQRLRRIRRAWKKAKCGTGEGFARLTARFGLQTVGWALAQLRAADRYYEGIGSPIRLRSAFLVRICDRTSSSTFSYRENARTL